jgi:simple sugar transport system permease protein
MEINFADIFTYQLIRATLRSSAPIVMAVVAAIISKHANVFNLAIEGIMLFGALVGIVVSAMTGSWFIALLAAVGTGVFISLLIGLSHLRLSANILILGFSVNAIALGGTRLIMQRMFGIVGSYAPSNMTPFPRLNIPAFNNNPVLKSIFSDYSLMEVLSFVLILLLWVVLYKTKIGLRLRSVGLNETAAKTAGINTYRIKLGAIIVSGIFASMAGAHLSMGYTNMFAEGMTNGRGFMANAAMNFGGGNPISALLGCLVFGFSESLGARLQSYSFPNQFVLMLPYIVTVVILTISMIRQQSAAKREKLKKIKEHHESGAKLTG